MSAKKKVAHSKGICSTVLAEDREHAAGSAVGRAMVGE